MYFRRLELMEAGVAITDETTGLVIPVSASETKYSCKETNLNSN